MDNIRLRLLIAAFEHLMEGDAEDASHAFRNLADEIETQGCPEPDDLRDLVYNLNDMLEVDYD